MIPLRKVFDLSQSIILNAARYAERFHRGQLRKYTNQPYIIHPARVAGRISIYAFATDNMVAAAWLHDVIEDCNVSFDSLNNAFGRDIAYMVDELTNPSKFYTHLSRDKRKQIDREHIKTISNEAKIIKIYDRIDNLLDFPITDSNAIDFMKSNYYRESRLLFNELKKTKVNDLPMRDFENCLNNIQLAFGI
jgi:(p)ppGpp synthase/HD superfamily hydrolase